MGIITKLFERRSFDNQSWIQDWLKGKEVGSESYAGIPITPENAIKYSSVLAASRILSEGIAGVPLLIYKRLKEGKERATEHSLYNILHLRPNSEMTSFSFREIMMLHIIFWGNFYAQISEDSSGNVTELWPLLPWKMDVKRVNGKIIYKYRLPDNTEIIIPKDYILHIPGLSFDGIIGKSLIGCAREAIGLGLALEEFGSRFFGQGTQFGGFIEHPRTLGDKAYENLRASLKEKYRGISNAHKIFILEEGMKYSGTTMKPEDAQFLETRKFQDNEIAKIFNVSPHLLKNLDRATFNNIEHLGIEHVVYTLRPWCVRIEQSMTIQLFSDPEIQQFFIEFLLDGLLRGDIASRYAAYAIGKQWGWLSSDDIRTLENMNPLPEGQGKIYWMPLNMIDSKQSGQSKQIDQGQQASITVNNLNSPKSIESKEIRSAVLKSRIANSYRGLFEEATIRIIKFEKSNILKKAEHIFGKRNIKTLNFLEFLNEFYKEQYDEISKRIKPTINTYGKVIFNSVLEEIGSEVDSIKLDKFMEDYAKAFNLRYIASSKNRLEEIINNAISDELDPYQAVENKFNEWEETRPQVVANKEIIKIAGAVSYFTYQSAGIQRIMWVNTGSKSCPFCESLNGVIVGIEQPYMTKDGLMEAEGKEPLTFSSNIFHPPLHGGCVCMLSPA